MRLENAVFAALKATGTLASAAFYVGAAAHDASDRIIYNKTTGALTYNSNGNAAGGAVQFATLAQRAVAHQRGFRGGVRGSDTLFEHRTRNRFRLEGPML